MMQFRLKNNFHKSCIAGFWAVKAIPYEKQTSHILYCRILGSKAILCEKQPSQIFIAEFWALKQFYVKNNFHKSCIAGF